MEIVKEAYDDYTALDPKSKYYDAKATNENPRWCMVDVKFKKKFKNILSLEELKKNKKLADMTLLKKGNRLSIMPVSAVHWKTILNLAGA